MTRTRTGIAIAAGLALLAGAGPALADGMGYVAVTTAQAGGGEVGKAIPTTQRAALVRDGAAWSLILEPRYDRPKAGAAWLVPFAHCPTVSAADPHLLAELGLVTAPLFLDVCIQTCRCGEGGADCLPAMGGGASAKGDGGSTLAATAGTQPLDVDVWQTGTIGALDFAVISADDPADIPRWLDQGGDDDPPELAAFVTAHAGDYGCYFAAKLGVPDGEHDVFPAVRFDLDPRDPPSYPLRLTKLGVADGRTLGLTLYVVNPADEADDGTTTNVVPDGFEAYVPACDATSDAGYRACLERALDDRPPDLAVTFHDTLASRRSLYLDDRRLCSLDYDQTLWYDGSGWCIGTSSAVRGLPATWTPDVAGWMAGEARVTRYEARLPPEALSRDLVFRVGPGTPARGCQTTGECYGSRLWNWDGTLCRVRDAAGACARECTYDSRCPDGWTCAPLDGTSLACLPPAAGTTGGGGAVEDPLPRVDALHVAITHGCGYDCDDVCYGAGVTTAPRFGSPGRPATGRRPLPALALLLAGLAAAAGLLRRRGGSPVRALAPVAGRFPGVALVLAALLAAFLAVPAAARPDVGRPGRTEFDLGLTAGGIASAGTKVPTGNAGGAIDLWLTWRTGKRLRLGFRLGLIAGGMKWGTDPLAGDTLTPGMPLFDGYRERATFLLHGGVVFAIDLARRVALDLGFGFGSTLVATRDDAAGARYPPCLQAGVGVTYDLLALDAAIVALAVRLDYVTSWLYRSAGTLAPQAGVMFRF